MSRNSRAPLLAAALLAATGTSMLPAESFPMAAAVAGHTGEITILEPSMAKSGEKAILHITPSGLRFNITFGDEGTTNGFWDPTHGPSRREVLFGVLDYVAGVLNYSSDRTVELEVGSSQNDGTGFLALGEAFYIAEDRTFQSPASQYRLETGQDLLTGFPDLRLTVDFGWPWNNTLADPQTGQLDLYTVLLHEITHGLGFVTLSDSNGNSLFSPAFGRRTFNNFDRLLYRNNPETLLWNETTTDFQVPNSVLSGGLNSVVFRGATAISAYGGNIPLHTPNSYVGAVSVAHWQDSPEINELRLSVMRHYFTFRAKLRTYRAHELSALRDLGYNLTVDKEPSNIWMIQ